jgi:sugar phosphate permease
VVNQPVVKPVAARIERPSAVPGEGMVIWVLWMTYGAFYFCRQNISAAVPGIEKDIGYSKTEIGLVLGGLKFAYAIGQLINGQLAERIAARRLLAVGMLCSAALNVIFGFATGLYFLLFLWACNGYCQALGWTPCVRVAANWFPAERRGRMIGILGTSYQFTAALTYVIAGWSAEWLGWRGAFYVPAVLLAASALHMLFFLREAPDEFTDQDGQSAAPTSLGASRSEKTTWVDNIRLTLANPSLWFLAGALALLDACRYGFQDWGLTHLKEVQESGVGLAAVKYAILPIGGIAGALAAGWATDSFFHGRRAPVICLLLVVLGLCTLAYEAVARHSVWGIVNLLLVIGFAIFGPQVLLVGTAPADLARRGTAAAAAGFVNFCGYLGAFAGDQVTGYVVEHSGWPAAIGFWAACAFGAAVSAAMLWNASAPRPAEPVAPAPVPEPSEAIRPAESKV